METTGAYTQSHQGPQPRDNESVAREMEALLARRLPYFHRIAYRFLGNASDAEDAVQDALLTAYRHLDQFRGESQLSTWLSSIVFNSARMQLRRRPRHINVSLDEPIREERESSLAEQLASDEPTPEASCRRSEMRRDFAAAVTRLSPSLRTTLQLRDVEGFSIMETAEILGVSPGTVKAQLFRARARMRRLLSRHRTAVTSTP